MSAHSQGQPSWKEREANENEINIIYIGSAVSLRE